jgi:hypothetical protein
MKKRDDVDMIAGGYTAPGMAKRAGDEHLVRQAWCVHKNASEHNNGSD